MAYLRNIQQARQKACAGLRDGRVTRGWTGSGASQREPGFLRLRRVDSAGFHCTHELRAQRFHAGTVGIVEARKVGAVGIPHAGSAPSAYGSDDSVSGFRDRWVVWQTW